MTDFKVGDTVQRTPGAGATTPYVRVGEGVGQPFVIQGIHRGFVKGPGGLAHRTDNLELVAAKPREFKVGDRVRRIKSGWVDIKPGDEGTVEEAGTRFALKEFAYKAGYDRRLFELVEAAPPAEPAPFVPEFTKGDRVSVAYEGTITYTDTSHAKDSHKEIRLDDGKIVNAPRSIVTVVKKYEPPKPTIGEQFAALELGAKFNFSNIAKGFFRIKVGNDLFTTVYENGRGSAPSETLSNKGFARSTTPLVIL